MCLQRLRDAAERARDVHSQACILWQLGVSLCEAGAWREAEAPLCEALALLEETCGNSHLDIARVCNSLAVVCYKVRHYLTPLSPIEPLWMGIKSQDLSHYSPLLYLCFKDMVI